MGGKTNFHAPIGALFFDYFTKNLDRGTSIRKQSRKDDDSLLEYSTQPTQPTDETAVISKNLTTATEVAETTTLSTTIQTTTTTISTTTKKKIPRINMVEKKRPAGGFSMNNFFFGKVTFES